jgi:hypothetical protein
MAESGFPNAAPAPLSSHNSGESDPSVMSDSAGAAALMLVFVLLSCFLGLGVLIRMEIVKRFGLLSAAVAAIFAAIVLFFRP